MCLPLKPYKIEREWKHAGLSCAVVQAREGSNRCGYVRVPPQHPLHGKEYDHIDVDVHGGLTFAALEPCTEHEDGQGFWFGFDCAHFNDALFDPDIDLTKVSDDARSSIAIHRRFLGKYKHHFWSESEVVAETNRLAQQLSAARAKP